MRSHSPDHEVPGWLAVAVATLLKGLIPLLEAYMFADPVLLEPMLLMGPIPLQTLGRDTISTPACPLPKRGPGVPNGFGSAASAGERCRQRLKKKIREF